MQAIDTRIAQLHTAVVRPLANRMHGPTWIGLLVLLLAFGMRFHALDAQSLWNDEGNSLRLAQRSIPGLLDATKHDIHPPGYYLLLKLWIGAAGESEFALRMLSALQGALTVAAAVALGRVLFGRAAGLLAGLLVALSPFAVYYSQETRMYAQLALLAALSLWVFIVWIKHLMRGDAQVRRWAITLALLNAAGLYTQYTFPFTMLAQGALFVGWLAWMRWRPANTIPRRALIEYVALNAFTLLLFLPWLPTAWDQVTNWPSTGVDIALGDQLRTVATWITYGNTAGDIDWFALLWPAMLIAAGLFWPVSRAARQPRFWRVAAPAIWGGIVIAALFVSGAYREANLKFLLPAQIAASLLIGRGVVQMWETPVAIPRLTMRELQYIRRMIAAVCLFLLVIGQLEALDALHTNADYARPDYRAMAAQIVADPRPGDAIILDAPNQAEVFSYYYDGAAPVYELPRGLGGDDDQTRADVQAVIRDHERIFVLFWGEEERDPNRVVQATLDSGAFPVASTWVGDVRFAQYAVLGAAPTTPDAVVEAQFGDHIMLEGYALNETMLQPGDVVGVTLFWSADVPLDTRYKITVQVLAPDRSRAVNQHDAEPANNRAPMTTWEPGATITDTHGIVLPPDLAPGDYPVIVGVYDPDSPLDRLPVTVGGESHGDALTLITLTVH